MGLISPIQSIGQLKYSITHYSTEDGLSDNKVRCILKDRDGFMWFGTWAGINRFDGHNFIVYKSYPGDRSTLRNNRIDELMEDKVGLLWIKAYDNQVYRFDKNTEKFFALTDILPKHTGRISFSHMLLPDSGSIWLMTKNQGAYLITNSGSARPRAIFYGRGAKHNFQLPSDIIRFIHRDGKQAIWIGTDKGLVHLIKNASGNYVKHQLAPDFSSLDFTAVGESPGQLWFGTADGSLLLINPSTDNYQKWKLSAQRINAVSPSTHIPVIYVTTALGELVAFNSTQRSWKTTVMAKREQLLSIFEDKTGKLWICPEKKGIVLYDPAVQTLVPLVQEELQDIHQHIGDFKVFEDKKERIWAGLRNEGFGYYNSTKKKMDYFPNPPGAKERLFSNLTSSIYYDRDGILWLCSADGGIEKVVFHDNDFKHSLIAPESYLKAENDVRATFVDRQNRLWMATKVGKLYVTKDGIDQGKMFLNEPAEGLGAIYCIMEDSHGTLWIGTKERGLYAARPTDETKRHYKLTNYTSSESDVYSLSGTSVYSIIEDRMGEIWVATFGDGLNLIRNPQGMIRFSNNKNGDLRYPKDAYQRIRHLALDGKGKVWIGTTEGLLIAEPGIKKPGDFHFDVYSKQPGDKQSLGDNDIQFILRDSQNAMWVCTAVGGINKALQNSSTQKLRFLNISQKDGLPSDYILNCLEDGNKNLWLATQNGLACLSIVTNKIRNYDSNDGLPKAAFSESGGARLKNGDLVFGMTRGYLRFDPAQIKDYKIDAKLALTNLQVNNIDVKIPDTSVNGNANLQLTYDQNNISIDYTVLDYRAAGRQTFASRLLGLDTAWQNNKNQRRVSYTNLSPGNYTFQVKATKESLYLNTPLQTLSITILPPPWRTWWAYVIYLIAAAAILAIIRRTTLAMLSLRQHIAVEQKMAHLKMSFFTNVAHELRTPLTLILNPIEEIARTENLSHQGDEHIRIVRRNAERMQKFVNQLLDLRKVQSGRTLLHLEEVEIISFVTKLADYFSDAARQKEIRLSIQSVEHELPAWIDIEKIDVVIYNLLSNALKFTPEGRGISIVITRLPDGICGIEVADEGTGVPPEHLKNIFELYYEGNHTEREHLKGTGIGLALAKELVELHHGRIFAANNIHGGLSIMIELKTDKAHFAESEIKLKSLTDPPGVNVDHGQAELDYSRGFGLPSIIDDDAPMVLLVEDNEDLSSFLSYQLKRCYRVETAFDGEDGLKKARELLPDLIISDIIMPNMDGIKMLDIIKNDMTTSHIPVVLLSARLSVESQIEGLNYGADLYITKPFRNEFLLSSIANLLKQRKKLAQSMIGSKKVIDLKPGEIVITSQDETFLKNVIATIEKQMADQDLNIDTLAAAVSMSRSGFFKKFKSLTNMAPVEFIREIRLKRGKQFLDAGEHNIATIAYTVGFNHPKYFSSCFKDKYQVTPSEYLKITANGTINTKNLS
ncbi:MAG: two-component regulator propeller domain-containing protein [Mucilaginibacter sp.]|uniref:hybrid sensor histidine kinase/response regulator transcription factor n=1 Tax=Mucilaginibacter sp. TaxID=1882438 RepID=UPI0032678718